MLLCNLDRALESIVKLHDSLTLPDDGDDTLHVVLVVGNVEVILILCVALVDAHDPLRKLPHHLLFELHVELAQTIFEPADSLVIFICSAELLYKIEVHLLTDLNAGLPVHTAELVAYAEQLHASWRLRKGCDSIEIHF